jgi:hypothetical protein
MAKAKINVMIDDMEESAKQEADGCWNIKIRGKWLEVRYTGTKFIYCWDNNNIKREDAINILATV